MYEKEFAQKTIRTVRRKKIQDLLAVLFFFLLLPYTCSILTGIRQEETAEVLASVGNSDFILWEKENGTWRLTEEDFLVGALAACIPAEYQTETLRAQAVILRSTCRANLDEDRRIVQKSSRLECLDTEARRALWGDEFAENENYFREAVQDTEGLVLKYGGKVVSPPFFRLSAGATRNGAEIFGEGTFEWCRSIECMYDHYAESFLQEKRVKRQNFIKKLSAEGMSLPKENAKVTLTRDSAGYVLSVQCGEALLEGEKFRRIFELPSSCFYLKEEKGYIILQTRGVGHGLGFNQYAADLLAAEGKTYQELLNHFFEGLSLEKME